MGDKSSVFEYIRWFENICYHDVSMVGGKTASLGEMYQNLGKKGVKIPNGFGVTSAAYWFFLEENNLKDEIQAIIKSANLASPNELQHVGHKIRHAILSVLINGSYGLGENIVQGTVNPDEFYIFKPTLKPVINLYFKNI